MINPFNLSAQLSSLAPFIDTRPSAPLIQRRLFEASLMLCRICPEIPSDVVVAPPDANCDSVAHDMKGMLFVSHNDIEAFKSSAWAVALAPQSGICFKDLVRTDLYQFWYW